MLIPLLVKRVEAQFRGGRYLSHHMVSQSPGQAHALRLSGNSDFVRSKVYPVEKKNPKLQCKGRGKSKYLFRMRKILQHTFGFFFFFFLAWPHAACGILSSPVRDQTCAPCSGRVEEGGVSITDPPENPPTHFQKLTCVTKSRKIILLNCMAISTIFSPSFWGALVAFVI